MSQKITLILALLGFMISSNAQQLTTVDDSLLYIKSLEFVQSLKTLGVTELNEEIINKLIIQADLSTMKAQDASTDSKKRKYVLSKFNQIKMKEEGVLFLAENAKKEGVVSMDNGMQYIVLEKGEGTVSPKKSDKVRTHYHGTLIDGTVFDSSVQRNEPLEFGLGQVIQGWQDALSQMVVGDKWRVFIPYNLAYGERGAGGVIPPYATLIFEIELLDII